MSHFNLSLSAVQKWRSNQIVKAKLRLTVTFTMSNGGYHRSRWSADAIVIRRGDVERVHDYARNHASSRDFLLIRLPMKIGLRTGEICTLRIEDIEFESRSFHVLDSKRKELYPLPLDMLTLQLIHDLIQERLEGYVFTRSTSWKKVKEDLPLSVQEVWHITHKIGEEAGVKGFKPRTLRQYFAAYWLYVKKKSLAGLQEILRHKDPATTLVYAAKLRFFEDLQAEYEGVQNQPFVENVTRVAESICSRCGNLAFCKFAPLPSCVESCRYKTLKKEEMEHNRI